MRRQIVTALVVGLVVASCGGGQAAVEETTTTTDASATTRAAVESTTTSTTSTTLAPTTTTTLAMDPADLVELSTVVGGQVSGDGWLVEPGYYMASVGEHQLMLHVTEPLAYFDFGPQALWFGRAGTVLAPPPVFFGIIDPEGVIPGDRAGEHAPHDPIVPTYVTPMPDSLGTWIDQVTQLEATPGPPLEGSSLSGQSWDITVDPDRGSFPCPYGNCVSTISMAGGVLVMGDDDWKFRLWDFDDDGLGLYGFFQAKEGLFDEAVQLVEGLFASVTLEG